MKSNTCTRTLTHECIYHTTTTTHTINKLFRCCDFAIYFPFSSGLAVALFLFVYPRLFRAFSMHVHDQIVFFYWNGSKKNFAQILKLFFFCFVLKLKIGTSYRNTLLCLCIQRVMKCVTTLWKNVKWEWKEILNQCERVERMKKKTVAVM